jgi:membrane-associated phospholipid phosphatase
MIPHVFFSDREAVVRRVRAAGLFAILATMLAVLLIDRPLADWTHAHLHGQRLFIWLTWIVDPVPTAATVGLAALVLAVLAGWRPGTPGRVALAECLAVLLAVGLKDVFKEAVGRTWPETWTNGNPSWITHGVFTLDPFHGGQGWASFPSGHTAVISAAMGVLWYAVPRWRMLWLLPVLAVMVGLAGADFHWASDMVGGLAVGMAAAAGSLALVTWDRR